MKNGTDQIVEAIRRELVNNAEEKTKKSGERFFKEKVKLYGVKTAVVAVIAKKYFKCLKGKSKKQIFALCSWLWRSGYLEESFIACNWSYSLRRDYQPADFKTFEKWVKDYVRNWASCDTFSNHTLGAFLEAYPGFIPILKKWARSENRWMRRASAVSLIIPAKQGKFLPDILEISDILLRDTEDLVQKGYGWLLKAASRVHQQQVFEYVIKNKKTMPRTALRYAIETMPRRLKVKAMEK